MQNAWNRFASLGDVNENQEQFDNEFADEANRRHYGNLWITKNWIYNDDGTAIFLMPIARVTWVYAKNTNNVTSIVIYFDDNSNEIFYMKHEDIVGVLTVLSNINSNIIVGYSEDLATAYLSNKKEFKKKVGESPKIYIDATSPFNRNGISTYFETIVYAKIYKQKIKCHLALTQEQEMKVILFDEDDKIIFSEDISSLVRLKWKGYGLLKFIFESHGQKREYIIKSYNCMKWRKVLYDAKDGNKIPDFLKSESYSDINSYNYTLNQNKYYFRFITYPISLILFVFMQYIARKDNILWDDGIFLGIITYYVFPLLIPHIFVMFLFRVLGNFGEKIFNKIVDSE
ncbi:MAG: hypothetical protein LBT51_10050 [Fusobacteriaceae bacterium]|jgi:hypothetical protein|nr:hypothetical protein [Fusobacteriaceae bacterium]